MKRALVDGAIAQCAGLPMEAPPGLGKFESDWLDGWVFASARTSPACERPPLTPDPGPTVSPEGAVSMHGAALNASIDGSMVVVMPAGRLRAELPESV